MRAALALLIALSGLACSSGPSTDRVPDGPPSFSCPPSQIAFARELLVLVNRVRTRGARLPVRRDPLLAALAISRAESMVSLGQLDHAALGGPAASLQSVGLRRSFVGENLARVRSTNNTAKEAVRFWVGRRTETQNLLDARYLRAGVGLKRGQDGCYCVLLLTD